MGEKLRCAPPGLYVPLGVAARPLLWHLPMVVVPLLLFAPPVPVPVPSSVRCSSVPLVEDPAWSFDVTHWTTTAEKRTVMGGGWLLAFFL